MGMNNFLKLDRLVGLPGVWVADERKIRGNGATIEHGEVEGWRTDKAQIFSAPSPSFTGINDQKRLTGHTAIFDRSNIFQGTYSPIVEEAREFRQ